MIVRDMHVWVVFDVKSYPPTHRPEARRNNFFFVDQIGKRFSYYEAAVSWLCGAIIFIMRAIVIESQMKID